MFESTQSKYKRVAKEDVLPEIAEHEVRITTMGQVKKYVDYALGLFGIGPVRPSSAAEDGAEASEPKIFEEIVLKATGRAINHAVTTAEVVKRRVPGLHQITNLSTLEIEDDWEPTEEGLETVTTTRRVASVEIVLKKSVSEAEKSDPGYQAPLVLPPLHSEVFSAVQLSQRRIDGSPSAGRRRRGRGRRGGGGSPGPSDGARSPGRRRGGGGGGGGHRDGGSDRGSSRGGRDDRDTRGGGGRQTRGFGGERPRDEPRRDRGPRRRRGGRRRGGRSGAQHGDF